MATVDGTMECTDERNDRPQVGPDTTLLSASPKGQFRITFIVWVPSRVVALST